MSLDTSETRAPPQVNLEVQNRRLRRYLAAARAECQALRAERDALRGVLTPPRKTLPDIWRLSPQQRIVFFVLLYRGPATADQIYDALYAGRADYGEVDAGIVKVLMSQMRRKLAPTDIVIEWTSGGGYVIAPDSLSRLRALMGETDPS